MTTIGLPGRLAVFALLKLASVTPDRHTAYRLRTTGPSHDEGGSAVALMTHDGDRSDVDIISSDDVRRSVTEALASLGISLDELERQAADGRFESDRARLVWMAIRRVARASA
jgi:hypothetical protein